MSTICLCLCLVPCFLVHQCRKLTPSVSLRAYDTYSVVESPTGSKEGGRERAGPVLGDLEMTLECLLHINSRVSDRVTQKKNFIFMTIKIDPIRSCCRSPLFCTYLRKSQGQRWHLMVVYEPSPSASKPITILHSSSPIRFFIAHQTTKQRE